MEQGSKLPNMASAKVEEEKKMMAGSPTDTDEEDARVNQIKESTPKA